MAELADALVLGTSGHPVQVQVLLSAGKKKYRLCGTFFVIIKESVGDRFYRAELVWSCAKEHFCCIVEKECLKIFRMDMKGKK